MIRRKGKKRGTRGGFSEVLMYESLKRTAFLKSQKLVIFKR
jgi:hypothetical protein